jgi:protein TonB
VVKVRVRVGVDGEVREVTLESSCGHAVLDRAALDGVRRWRFRPGRRGGKPVESEVVVPVDFRLERS